MSVRILIGDCRELLKELPDNSVDSVKAPCRKLDLTIHAPDTA